MIGMFKKLPATFHAWPYYAEALRGRAGGLGWLMFVAFVVSVVYAAGVHWKTITAGPPEAEAFIEQMPVLRFDDGRLATEPAGETQVMADGRAVLIVDDGIQGVPDDLRGVRAMLTRDFFVTVQNSGQIRAHPYDWIGDRTVTHDDWRRWWSWWLAWGWIALVLAFFLYFAIGWAVFALCAALGGMAIKGLLGVEAGFGGLYRVATLAMVPVIAIVLVLDIAEVQGIFGFWPRLAVALGFIGFALKRSKDAAPAVDATVA